MTQLLPTARKLLAGLLLSAVLLPGCAGTGTAAGQPARTEASAPAPASPAGPKAAPKARVSANATAASTAKAGSSPATPLPPSPARHPGPTHPQARFPPT